MPSDDITVNEALDGLNRIRTFLRAFDKLDSLVQAVPIAQRLVHELQRKQGELPKEISRLEAQRAEAAQTTDRRKAELAAELADAEATLRQRHEQEREVIVAETDRLRDARDQALAAKAAAAEDLTRRRHEVEAQLAQVKQQATDDLEAWKRELATARAEATRRHQGALAALADEADRVRTEIGTLKTEAAALADRVATLRSEHQHVVERLQNLIR